jgi:hypothetical protein
MDQFMRSGVAVLQVFCGMECGTVRVRARNTWLDLKIPRGYGGYRLRRVGFETGGHGIIFLTVRSENAALQGKK